MAKQKKKKIKFYEIGNPNIPCLKHQEHSFQYISYDFIATNSETMNRYAIICNNCGKYFLDVDKFKELKDACNKYEFVPNEPRNKKMKLKELQDLVNKRFKESKIFVILRNHEHALTYSMPVKFSKNTIHAFYCKDCDKFYCMYDDVKHIDKIPSKYVFSKASLERKAYDTALQKIKDDEKSKLNSLSNNDNQMQPEKMIFSSKKESNMYDKNKELRIVNKIKTPYFSTKRYGFRYIDGENQRLVEMNVYTTDERDYILSKDYIKNSIYGTIEANLVGDIPSLPKRDVPKLITNDRNIVLYVKTANRKCVNGNHQLNDIKMNINLLNDNGQLINKNINVFSCSTCNINYIYDDLYYNLVKYGQPTCLIVDETIYKSIQKKGSFNFSADSILTLYGYNVNQSKDLSSIQRQNILKSLVDTKIVKRNFAIEHIKFLINSRKSRLNHKIAVSRWREDVEFLENYTSSSSSSNNTIDKIIVQKRI